MLDKIESRKLVRMILTLKRCTKISGRKPKKVKEEIKTLPPGIKRGTKRTFKEKYLMNSMISLISVVIKVMTLYEMILRVQTIKQI